MRRVTAFFAQLAAVGLFIVMGCGEKQPRIHQEQTAEGGRGNALWAEWRPPDVTLPQENAHERYVDAYEEYGDLAIDAQLREAGQLPTGQLRQLIERASPVYEHLENAQELHCRWPRATPETYVSPDLSFMRDAGRLFWARSKIRQSDGDLSGSADDAVACVLVGSHAASRRDFNALLTARPPYLHGVDRVHELSPALQAAVSRTIIGELVSAINARPSLGEILDGEAVLTKSFFRIALQEPDHAIAEQLEGTEFELSSRAIDRNGAWIALDNYVANFATELNRPYRERQFPSPPRNVLVRAFVPTLDSWTEVIEYGTTDLARLRLTLVELALHAYQRDNGGFPEDLTELSPIYLSSVPQDPFTQDTLGRATVEGRTVMYSLGPDGVDGTGTDAESDDDIVVELER